MWVGGADGGVLMSTYIHVRMHRPPSHHTSLTPPFPPMYIPFTHLQPVVVPDERQRRRVQPRQTISQLGSDAGFFFGGVVGWLIGLGGRGGQMGSVRRFGWLIGLGGGERTDGFVCIGHRVGWCGAASSFWEAYMVTHACTLSQGNHTPYNI